MSRLRREADKLLRLHHTPVLAKGTAGGRPHDGNALDAVRIRHDGLRQEPVVEVELARPVTWGRSAMASENSNRNSSCFCMPSMACISCVLVGLSVTAVSKNVVSSIPPPEPRTEIPL